MLVPMTKVQILGRRSDVERVIGELHRLGLVEIADARASHAVDGLGGGNRVRLAASELGLLAAQTDELLGCDPARRRSDDEPRDPRPLDAGGATPSWSACRPEVEALGRRLDALRDERLVLPGTWSRSGCSCRSRPSSPTSTTSSSASCGWARSHSSSTRTTSRSSRRSATSSPRSSAIASHLAWTRVDGGSIGCLVVFRHRHRDAVRALLGRAQVRQAALPEAFESLSLSAAVEAMQRRLAELPQAIDAVRAEREALLLPHAARLRALRAAIARRARAARARSSGWARRSARSSPSAGFPGATWRA